MQTAAEATQEEADPKDALIAALSRSVSWGYVRAGNAYKREVAPKPRVPALDIPPVAAQLPDG
jgi:hypothetical protein